MLLTKAERDQMPGHTYEQQILLSIERLLIEIRDELRARPMTGFFETLTPEQKDKALAYRGADC